MNELKVDKSLLINDFDTYKLSFEKFSRSKENVAEGVKVKLPNDDQFSFLHHKEFSFHNHLYKDVWNGNDVYFITNDGKVKKALINYQVKKIFGLIETWNIPEQNPSKASNFNASITFASPELAVISDGKGFLYIVQTSNRKEITEWKMVYGDEILGEGKEFKISVNQLEDEKSSKRRLHCILLSIEHSITGPTSHSKTAGFDTVLSWIVLSEGNEGTWDKEIVNELRGHGSVDYLALELGCQALYVISEREFYSAALKKVEEMTKLENNCTPEPDYYWQQTQEDVQVWFNMDVEVGKSDVTVETKCNYIKILCKEKTLLCDNFFWNIDAALTTWTLENCKLEVIMKKAVTGQVWESLLVSSSKIGKEIISDKFAAEIHDKLAHLCSDKQELGDAAMLNSGEVEECDAFGENRYLRRFHIKSGTVTHKILLGSDQWLFQLEVNGYGLPAFCMRRDVDGIVWQPKQPNIEDEYFECSHIHTFPAFGYIAASKLDKKFLIAPANLSYVAVVNNVGHVVVYRERSLADESVSLRNRKTGAKSRSVYIQNLINLESNSQIVGAIAGDDCIYVLTITDLIMICLNSD